YVPHVETAEPRFVQVNISRADMPVASGKTFVHGLHEHPAAPCDQDSVFGIHRHLMRGSFVPNGHPTIFNQCSVPISMVIATQASEISPGSRRVGPARGDPSPGRTCANGVIRYLPPPSALLALSTRKAAAISKVALVVHPKRRLLPWASFVLTHAWLICCAGSVISSGVRTKRQ